MVFSLYDFCFLLLSLRSSVSISSHLASRWCSVLFRLSEGWFWCDCTSTGQKSLRGFIYWDYGAGSDASRYECDRNPNKEQRLGCVCVIVYHRVLSVIIVGIIMAFIQYPATCVRLPESFSQKQRQTMKKMTQKFSVWSFIFISNVKVQF